MKKTNVYMCSKGHLHYCDEEPESCKHQNCDCKDFGMVSSDFEVEDDDGISDESGYSNY